MKSISTKLATRSGDRAVTWIDGDETDTFLIEGRPDTVDAVCRFIQANAPALLLELHARGVARPVFVSDLTAADEKAAKLAVEAALAEQAAADKAAAVLAARETIAKAAAVLAALAKDEEDASAPPAPVPTDTTPPA